MLTAAVAIVFAILLGVAEILDWQGRLELIEKDWPKVHKAMNSRPARLVALLFLIVFIAHDVEKHSEVPKEPTVVFGSIPAPVMQIVKMQPSSTPVESPNSLRRRTIQLVDDLVLFWSERPQPAQQRVQNPTTDEERQRNAKWDQYWRDTGAAYANAGFRERVLGIVRQYRAKGLDIGYLEQAAEQPERLVGAYFYGGADLNGCWRYMTELCQLRELAYHVDANDDMIILGPKPEGGPPFRPVLAKRGAILTRVR